MEERDLRNVILILVRAHKTYKSRASAHQMFIQEVLDGSASRTPVLTLADIERKLPEILEKTDQVANAEAQQVEAALSGENDFLEALRVYASRQFWPVHPPRKQ